MAIMSLDISKVTPLEGRSGTMASFSALPPEVIVRVLIFLDIPDLFNISRACHYLRHLACDPLLHHQRLHHASYVISLALAHRPSRSTISPPNAWIWLGKTHVLSRSIAKSLTKIRLSHNLEHRPSASDLVARAILPPTCTNYSSVISPALIQSQQAVERHRLRDGLGRKLDRRPSLNSLVSANILPEECARPSISPAIVATRRRIMKENLKDGLRAWVDRRGVVAQRQRADELDASERRTVKSLVRRFAARKQACDLEVQFDIVAMEKKRAQERWGQRPTHRVVECQQGRINEPCAQPTRAHVLALKRFWEGVSRAATTCP